MPKQRSDASDDCFACAKTETKCDRKRPYCSQCLEGGKKCSGYKTQLTWGVGVASRGKLRGLSLPVANSSAAPATPLAKEVKITKQQPKGVNRRNIQVLRHHNCRLRKTSSIPEPSFLELPCSICREFHDDEVMLICDGCDHPYYTYCVGLKALPPEEEKWFCKPCGGVPPPITCPEKKLPANEIPTQRLFLTRGKNTKGELDLHDEIQKKEPLTIQRKQEEAARYVLGICHCGFCLTVLPGY